MDCACGGVLDFVDEIRLDEAGYDDDEYDDCSDNVIVYRCAVCQKKFYVVEYELVSEDGLHKNDWFFESVDDEGEFWDELNDEY